MGYQEITLEVDGDKSLIQEAGGHRLQRVPPTERKGRVHTSTVTVAVLGNDVAANPIYDMRDEKDFYVEWFSGTGKGGQKRNKSQSCCRLYHLPTGLMESRQGRSRDNNFNDAKATLCEQLDLEKNGQVHSENAAIKKDQVGSGMRGDKIRTIRFQDDQATDHRTSKSITAKKYMRGFMDELWE